MKYYFLAVLAIAALFTMATGCSRSMPVAPSAANDASMADANGDPVMFAARVATTDQSRAMLTFMGVHDSVVAARNCEIVRLNGDSLAPIPFSELKPFDSIHVQGVRQQNGYVMAHRLQVCSDSCYDLAFRDTIATIDYAAGSFTVVGRPEVVTIDDATLIWGSATKRQATYRDRYAHEYGLPEPASVGTGSVTYRRDAVIALTDLQQGDVVEVKANVVNADTLLAVAIRLASCSDFETRCVQFEAVIATLDVDLRAVTFVDLPWLGTVCKGARLLDAGGLEVELSAFSVGDAVAVKGLPLEDDALRICEMVEL